MVLAVPTQDSWTVGEIVTAALMNKNVRDAVNFLANPPMWVGVQTVGQSVASGATTPLTIDTEVSDAYGGHSTSTNTDRYTAVVAGWYFCIGQWSLPSNSTGTRSLGIQVTGANPTAYFADGVQNTSDYRWQVSGLVYLSVGDYWRLAGSQASGSSLTTSGAIAACFWMHA